MVAQGYAFREGCNLQLLPHSMFNGVASIVGQQGMSKVVGMPPKNAQRCKALYKFIQGSGKEGN